jgi:hypothetical protein
MLLSHSVLTTTTYLCSLVFCGKLNDLCWENFLPCSNLPKAKKLRRQSAFLGSSKPRERWRSKTVKVKVDSKRWIQLFFLPLLRTRMAFRSPFSATINALLPEASSSKRAEQPRRKAYSHATTKDKEIRAGNRERGKPLKIQYIIGCAAEAARCCQNRVGT